MGTDTFPEHPDRSIIIPVLDDSPHSRFNIHSLLDELKDVAGEVICVFNGRKIFDQASVHPRIDKYCLNNMNAGVSRSWNMGINLAEGDYYFLLNADLHIELGLIEKLELYLQTLTDAVIVGPEGSNLQFTNEELSVRFHFKKNVVTKPTIVDNVSGFCMAIDANRFKAARLAFDNQFSPCFMEEWDMGLQVQQAGMRCYVVPVKGYEHSWGISLDRGQVLDYFKYTLSREQIMKNNIDRFSKKWFSKLRNLD